MKRKQLSKWWLSAIALTLLMLALAGCGDGTTSTPQDTKTTAAGSISTTNGNSGVSALSVNAPAGVTLSIPANTVFTDNSGAPVTGSVVTSVSYSATAADLPAAAATLPTGATLVAFAEISLNSTTASVKNFSNPVSLAFKVPAGVATTGDALVVYSFNNGSGQWSFAGTEIVDANGNVTPGITHLSIWGVFKGAAPVPPAPPRPSGVAVSGGDGKVTISWNAVSDATSYNIYYAETAGVTTASGIKIAGVSTPQELTGLTNGKAYFFVVTAVNAGGEGVVSSEKTATPAAAPQAPGSPTGVTATAEAGQMTVAWKDTVPGATGYNVYYLQSAATPTTATVIGTGTKVVSQSSPFVVTGLTAGSNYWFTVTAVNAGGESEGQTNPKKAVPL